MTVSFPTPGQPASAFIGWPPPDAPTGCDDLAHLTGGAWQAFRPQASARQNLRSRRWWSVKAASAQSWPLQARQAAPGAGRAAAGDRHRAMQGEVAYASPCSAPAMTQALLAATSASRTNPGRLLPRRDASRAARSPRGHGPHQGRRGCAHAVARKHAPTAGCRDECLTSKGLAGVQNAERLLPRECERQVRRRRTPACAQERASPSAGGHAPYANACERHRGLLVVPTSV